jgi:hypothetical protein
VERTQEFQKKQLFSRSAQQAHRGTLRRWRQCWIESMIPTRLLGRCRVERLCPVVLSCVER